MEQAVFIVLLGMASIVGPTIWCASQRPDSIEDAIQFFASLDLRTHQRLTFMLGSGLSFLIMGLALLYAPG